MCRVKEGTSTVFLQSGLNENWWADSLEKNVAFICETSQSSCLMGRRFGKLFKRPIIPFGSFVEYHLISAIDQSRIRQFGQKVLPGLFLGYALYAGEFGRVTYWLQTLRSWRRWTHRKSLQKDSMQRNLYFQKE